MLSHLLPLLFLLVCPLGMAAIMLGPGRCAGSGVVPAMAPGTARDRAGRPDRPCDHDRGRDCDRDQAGRLDFRRSPLR
jgi:hypothetical protein